MRRYKEPAALVLFLALLASLAVHLPVYEGLGELAAYFRAIDARRSVGASSAPVELDFEVLDSAETVPSEPLAAAEPEPDDSAGRPSREAARPRSTRHAEARPEPPAPPRPETPPPVVPVQPEVALPAPTPPPPSTAPRHAITQRSQDPTVEPPPDTQYIAEENSRVEEETIASVTNMVTDDSNPVAADPSAAAAMDAEREGNAEESQLAEARELPGEETRSATPEEAARERPEESGRVVAEVEGPRHDAAQLGGGAGDDAAGRDEAAGETRTAAPAARARVARGGGAAPRELETITVHDGIGTFVVTRPAPSAVGSGEGSGGGPREDGRSGARASSPALRAGAAGAGARSGPRGPGAALSWSQFEQVMGETQLREEREAYVAERRTKIRGNSHQRRFAEFRAALDNNVIGVRPGNQTALNAAASPFANYIAAVHRRIHQEFAGRFLAGLPAFSSSPFSDPNLHTKLEIVINRDGTVHRIGVVGTSGYLPFDYGAFNSVMRAQPYPAAPSAILSGDGRVYLHWTFHRGPSQCGQWNAEPYILPHPPGGPGQSSDGMIDGPEAMPLVPEGATPTWGTEQEGGLPGGGHEEHEPAPPAEGAPPPAGPRTPSPAPRPRGNDEAEPPRVVPAVPPGAALG